MKIRHCSNCGQECLDITDKSCKVCGYELPDITDQITSLEPKQPPHKKIFTTILHFLKKKPKFVIGIAVSTLCLLLVTGIVAYRNTSGYLEKKLLNGNWTYIMVTSNGIEYRTESTVQFYPDGVVVKTSPNGSKEYYEWEILEDKTMVFDGRYFDHGNGRLFNRNEWYCNGWDVVIGDYFQCTERPESYISRPN